ncbi:hypothetical protein KTAU_30840 [Thermogemmatispora aurantia]|nr:hypothetical protein KTAU_30840 [Thermogemmatispora aurantia]
MLDQGQGGLANTHLLLGMGDGAGGVGRLLANAREYRPPMHLFQGAAFLQGLQIPANGFPGHPEELDQVSNGKLSLCLEMAKNQFLSS